MNSGLIYALCIKVFEMIMFVSPILSLFRTPPCTIISKSVLAPH